jgi:hypothetical protein
MGRLLRTTGLVVAAVVMVGGFAVSPAGAAKKPPFEASGSATCGGQGKIKLATSHVGSTLTIGYALQGRLGCSGTTGDPAVRLTGGRLQYKFNYQGDCDALGTAPYATGFVTWRSKGGRLVSSSIIFSNSELTASGLRSPATSPPGIGNVSGSYKNDDRAVVDVQNPTAMSMIQNGCNVPKQKTVIFTSFTFSI